MNPLNVEFMEEYKLLDKIIMNAYCSEKGVTEYIDIMTEKAEDASMVPDWEFDFSQLKRLRHIRNRLSHEAGAFDEKLCTKTDILWLSDFIKRIIEGTDPLTLLRKSQKAKTTRIVHHRKEEQISALRKFLLIIIPVTILLVLFLFAIYFAFYY